MLVSLGVPTSARMTTPTFVNRRDANSGDPHSGATSFMYIHSNIGACPPHSGRPHSAHAARSRSDKLSLCSRTSHAACAITHTRGDKSVTAVVNGSITSTGTSSYQLPEKRGDGRALLTWAGKRAGSTTTTVGDRSNTCVVDVTETYDPATRTFTVVGSVCGRDVSGTRKLGG